MSVGLFFQIYHCGLCICENKHSLRLEVVTNLVNKNDEHIVMALIINLQKDFESDFQGSKIHNKKTPIIQFIVL